MLLESFDVFCMLFILKSKIEKGYVGNTKEGTEEGEILLFYLN